MTFLFYILHVTSNSRMHRYPKQNHPIYEYAVPQNEVTMFWIHIIDYWYYPWVILYDVNGMLFDLNIFFFSYEFTKHNI